MTGPSPADPDSARAVRVSVTVSSRRDGDPTIVVSPTKESLLVHVDRMAGAGLLGGVAPPPAPPARRAQAGSAATGSAATGPAAGAVTEGATGADRGVEAGEPSVVLVDGEALRATLIELGGGHARLTLEGSARSSTRLVLGPASRRSDDGITTREVVVEGWRVVLEVEPEQRAALRERAHRARAATGAGGPVEVHAIIPGRIVAVSVAAGDAVTAGQQVLVLEAMKMQNELRAPREGAVERVAVSVGDNVEVGDLLLVIR